MECIPLSLSLIMERDNDDEKGDNDGVNSSLHLIGRGSA